MHPCDDISTEWLTVQLSSLSGPSYMRTARNKRPRIHDDDSVAALRIGKGHVLREGSDVALLACGILVGEAMTAAEVLSSDGIEVTVVDMHTIKPLDSALVQRLAADCGALVTAEDHSIIGGLGGAVAELLAANCPVPLERVGVNDTFGESGDGDELLEKYGLNSDYIIAAARRAIARKA